jgi:dienelactone hydrolase
MLASPALRRALGALLLSVAPAAGALAQGQQPSPKPAALPQPQAQAKIPPLTIAKPFTWEQTPEDRGLVRIPLGRTGGWKTIVDPGYQARLVPGYSSDPTAEVILWPPLSGIEGKPERFLVQFSLAALGAGPNPTVVAFHPYGVSEKSPFVGTALPALCQERGWVLIAAYGLVDTNYASVDSQTALVAVLDFVDDFLPIDRTRLWAVGFSMGGLNALSFGMRHQDPNGFRFAGIVDHSGPIDAAKEYADGDALLKSILEDADHFGGAPADEPFAYERVSPAPLTGGAIDTKRASVENLLHVPLYLHCNLQDPAVSLVAQTQLLHAFLAARGADTVLSAVNGGGQHVWSTLDLLDAFAFLEGKPLVALPAAQSLHADRPGKWLATELLAAPAATVARYRVERVPGANALELRGTHAVDALRIDLPALGLAPSAPLYLGAESGDGTADALVLWGYAAAPSSVTVLDVLPIAWSHDAGADTLAFTPQPFGAYVPIVVKP